MKIDGFTPINKTAAIVTANGIHYIPKKKIQTVHSETPLPLIGLGKNEKDLTGKKIGRLTVVGKYKSGLSKGALWSCRCDCGRYTARKSKSINNPNNDIDCCEECRNLMFLKLRDKK